MLNILTEDNVGLAFILGAVLLGGFIVSLILGWAWTWAWFYLDDGEKKISNPVVAFIIKNQPTLYYLRGAGSRNYTTNKAYEGKSWMHVPSEYCTHTSWDQWGRFWKLGFLLGISPIFTLLAVAFYPVTLTIFTLYSLMFVARSARRLSKKFTSHTVDLNAHKKEEI